MPGRSWRTAWRTEAAEEEYNKNLARVRTLTDGGQFYYEQKVEKAENMDDLPWMTREMDELKEQLIRDKLRDIQDVRNAIKTRFLKEFPQENKVTFLAYIRMDQYKALIDNYDREVYGKETSAATGAGYFREADPPDQSQRRRDRPAGERIRRSGLGIPLRLYRGNGSGIRYGRQRD